MLRMMMAVAMMVVGTQAAHACLTPGEEIFDPGDYVARYYECPTLTDVGELALPPELLMRWNRAVASGRIDEPFVIMGNDHMITDLSVLEHEVRTPNPRSIEIVIRARFNNFGEGQVIDWVFFDDLSNDDPMLLVDIQGVAPYTYSMADRLRSFGK